MRRNTCIALFILFMISVFGFYVSAQIQIQQPQGEVRKALQEIDRFQQEKRKMVRDTLLIKNTLRPAVLPVAGTIQDEITLFIGISQDGRIAHAVVRQSNSSVSNVEKLRIEMLDGSVREVDMKQIKRITVR